MKITVKITKIIVAFVVVLRCVLTMAELLPFIVHAALYESSYHLLESGLIQKAVAFPVVIGLLIAVISLITQGFIVGIYQKISGSWVKISFMVVSVLVDIFAYISLFIHKNPHNKIDVSLVPMSLVLSGIVSVVFVYLLSKIPFKRKYAFILSLVFGLLFYGLLAFYNQTFEVVL